MEYRHTIYPSIKELLSPAGIESTPFRNLASKVAGLQVQVHVFLIAVNVITRLLFNEMFPPLGINI